MNDNMKVTAEINLANYITEEKLGDIISRKVHLDEIIKLSIIDYLKKE